MMIENQGGFLFEDIVIESLLKKFNELTYDEILVEIKNGSFKFKESRIVDEELSLKTGRGAIVKPYFVSFNTVTYKEINLDFKGKVGTMYLDAEKYSKELLRQGIKFK